MFEPETDLVPHVSPNSDGGAHAWEAAAEQKHGHVLKRGRAHNYGNDVADGILHFGDASTEGCPRFCVACGNFIPRWGTPNGFRQIEPTDCPVNPPDKKTKRAKKA